MAPAHLPMAAPFPLFDVCVRAQAASMELVVFAPSVRQAVQIAWYFFFFLLIWLCYPYKPPLYRPMTNGRRIRPQGLRPFLRRHGLHWGCFCSLISDESLSCRIVHTESGLVIAFCHSYPSACGFRCKYIF